MNNRNYDCIIIISVISGLFITTCDYLVQMKTVETDYFVSRLLSLEETILNLSSFGCIFTFPFWILGTYFIYTTMCKVNKKLALINTFCISYSLLMLGFYRLSGNFWLVSFKISYLCLPLFYEPRTTPSCHPSGCAYRQL